MYYITPKSEKFYMLNVVLKEKVFLLSALKMVVLLKICVETLIHFFSGFFDG